MKRQYETRKVIDLGVASRETKGGLVGISDTKGRQANFGLSND